MKKHHLLFIILSLLIFSVAVTSCTSDDDPQKIELGEGTSTSVSLGANRTKSALNFSTSALWSAWTTKSVNGGPEEVEWLHLDITRGSAGSAVINVTLLPNTTGQSRTVYIVIVCEDERIVITITQTAEDDPDIDDPDVDEPAESLGSGIVEMVRTDYWEHGGGTPYSETTFYTVEYEGDRPMRMLTIRRDEFDNGPGDVGHDSYCDVRRTYDFTYTDTEVTIDGLDIETYYPSGKVVYGEKSRHIAQLDVNRDRVVSGTYHWDNDPASSWTASYDASGHLLTTGNNDATSKWETFDFTWNAGCLTQMKSTFGGVVNLVYGDPSLKNHHKRFDLNWVLPQNLECYDFAAGDITRHFAVCGLMGVPSKTLATEIVEKFDGRTVSSRITYKENTADKTVVTVTGFVDGKQRYYSEVEVKYTNVR